MTLKERTPYTERLRTHGICHPLRNNSVFKGEDAVGERGHDQFSSFSLCRYLSGAGRLAGVGDLTFICVVRREGSGAQLGLRRVPFDLNVASPVY